MPPSTRRHPGSRSSPLAVPWPHRPPLPPSEATEKGCAHGVSLCLRGRLSLSTEILVVSRPTAQSGTGTGARLQAYLKEHDPKNPLRAAGEFAESCRKRQGEDFQLELFKRVKTLLDDELEKQRAEHRADLERREEERVRRDEEYRAELGGGPRPIRLSFNFQYRPNPRIN